MVGPNACPVSTLSGGPKRCDLVQRYIDLYFLRMDPSFCTGYLRDLVTGRYVIGYLMQYLNVHL